jgi:glycosyltransferase involved in cell wall biosynthesis
MKLLLVNRKPRAHGNYSLEVIYSHLWQELSHSFNLNAESWRAPFVSEGMFSRFFSFLTLLSKCLNKKYDVIHVTGDVHFLIWAAVRAKRVLTIHDVGFLKNSTGVRFHVLKYFWLTGPLRIADVVICVSQATKMELIRLCPEFSHKIQIIPSTIDPRFQYNEKVFNHLKPTVLLIGSAANKNLKRTIKALHGLSVKLCIVAKIDSDILEMLEGMSFECFRDLSTDEIISKYIESDILSFCSTHEGFGMPIIEAQKIGRVVITSNCSSMPEVGGDGAFYTDPFSVESIRSAFIAVLSDSVLRQNLIKNGLLNCQKYELAEFCKSHYRTYNRILQ